MRKFANSLLISLLVISANAFADTFTLNANHPIGNYGSSTTTVGGIKVDGFYFNTSTGQWVGSNLFGRNETNDHGLGVCSIADGANCGTGSGGGDFNELDNAGGKELIRLALPNGFSWTSIQLSSLDQNSSTDPTKFERGVLWADADGNPNSIPPGTVIGDNVICSFSSAGFQTCTSTGGFEPVLTVPTAYANSNYLFFEAKDWLNGTNTNNDFLVWQATVNPVPEPGSLVLLGSGLVGAVGAIRRKLIA